MFSKVETGSLYTCLLCDFSSLRHREDVDIEAWNKLETFFLGYLPIYYYTRIQLAYLYILLFGIVFYIKYKFFPKPSIGQHKSLYSVFLSVIH